MIHNVPALPVEYCGDFSAHSGTVEAHLLRNILHVDQAHLHVLRGMGGTGKSTTLMAIGHHGRIQDRFVAAVWFIALGQSAVAETLLSSLTELIRTVCDDQRAEGMVRRSALRNNQRGAIVYAVDQLADAAVLLILDDVWKENKSDSVTQTPVFDLVRELALGLSSKKGPMRLVISSRNATVAYNLPRVLVVRSGNLGTHSPAARAVICKYADFKSEEEVASLGTEAREAFLEVLDQCQGLQLALAVAGKNVRELLAAECVTREHVWQMFRNSILESPSFFLGDKSPNDQSMSVGAIVESSLHTVEVITARLPREKELDINSCFTDLGIMRTQRVVPWECLSLLWNCNPNTMTWFCRDLSQVHLVSVEKEHGIRLHQLIQDYCAQKSQDKGFHDRRHRQFLKTLDEHVRDPTVLHGDESSSKVREWWSLSGPNPVLQAYVLNNLLWHLVQAKRFNEGLPLLCDFRWTQTRVLRSSNANKVSGIEDDIELFLNTKGENWPEDVQRGLKLISEAIRLASQYICSNPRELAFQLYGRLAHQALQNEIVRRYIASLVNHATIPWLRPSHGVLQPVSDTVMRKASFEVPLECAFVIPNSEDIVLGGARGFLVLYNLSSTQILRIFVGHNNSEYVNDVIVAGKGQVLFSVSSDKSVRKWSVSTAENHGQYDCSNTPRCIAVTADEKYLLVGLKEGSVLILNAGNLSALSSWRCHHGAVRVVRMAPLTNSVLSGGDDGKVIKWRVAIWGQPETQMERKVLLEEPKQKARDISLFSDQRKAAIAVGFKIFVIDTQSETKLFWNEFDWKVLAVQVSLDQQSVYLGIEDGTTRLLDMNNRSDPDSPTQTPSLARSHNSRICRMALSADARSIVSVSADKTLSILKCNRSATKLPAHRREMYRLSNLAVFPDRQRVLFAWECDPHGSWMPGLHVLNLSESSSALMQREANNRNAGSDVDHVMTFPDSESITCLAPVACLDKAVTAIAVSKGENVVAAGTSNGEVLMFNPCNWNHTYFDNRKLPSKVVCIKFSPDNKLIAASCTESRVAVWKTDEDIEVELGTQPEAERVWVVEFNKESTGLVAIGDQEPRRYATVHIWRGLMTGQVEYERHKLSDMIGHAFTSIGVGLCMEGALFAMQSERFHAVRVYDFENNRRLSEEGELEFSRKLIQDHDNQCGSTKLSIAPFSSKIKYREDDGELITLGTLESSQCHSFSSDQWVFHEASGQLVAGGVLRKLVSATLIENRIGHTKLPSVPFLLEDYDAINQLSWELDSDDFTFFISHAGPDKDDIAIPLYTKLKERGKLSFVDIIGIHPGENAPIRMEKAIREAKVAIFILSPEFAARKWPMKELMGFQKRVREAENGGKVAPLLLPVFYRLSRGDCKDYELYKIETADGKPLFVREGFYEPARLRAMDWETVHGALKKLTEQSGILNKHKVKNRPAQGESAECRGRRDEFIDEIVKFAMMAARVVERAEKRKEANVSWSCTFC